MTSLGPTVLILLEAAAEQRQLNTVVAGPELAQGQWSMVEWAAIAPALGVPGGPLPGVPHPPDVVVLTADCFEHHWPQVVNHWSLRTPAALVVLPTVDDDRAAQVLAAGAADYLPLPHSSPLRLRHSLQQLWQQRQCQRQLTLCKTQDVFSQAAVAINMADASGRFLRVNQQFCDLVGYSEAELLQLTYQDITHPDDLNAQLLQERQLFDQERQSCTFEKRYLTKAGSPVWTRVTLSTVRDRAGIPISDLAVVENIDDRRRLEQALQASEVQLADVLSGSQACITRCQLFTDGTWAYDYYSPGSVTLYGYSPEAMRTDPKLWASRVVPADFQAVVVPALEAILAGRAEEIGTLEFRFCHRDGSIRWIQESCTVRWDAVAQCWWVTTVGVDISDRKRLETEREQALVALQRSEAKLLEAQQLAHLGHWEWVPQTGESWWSPELMDIFGFDASLQGPPPDIFMARVHPEDWPQLHAAIEELLAQGTPQRQHHRIVLSDGTVRHILWQGQAVFDPQGRVVKLFGIAQDVTEAKQTELALAASERKHRALVQALPDLIIRMDGSGQYLDFFAASDMVVLDGEELVGKGIYQQGLPPALADRRMAAIEAALATGELQHYEQELFNGQEQVTEEVRIVPDGDNEVVVIVRNISDRKRAEAALRTREQQLQLLVDALPFGIWMRDSDDRLVLQNRVDIERFGHHLGSALSDLDIPDCDTYLRTKQQARPGQILTVERWETVQGEPRYFQRLQGALPDMAGGMGMFGAYIDITQRQRTEQALRESQAQLAQAQAIAQIGSWEFDLTTQNILWSAEMFRICGLDPAQPEPSHREFQALVHPDDWPALDAAIGRAIATGQPYEVEHRIRRP
ncbi:MAG: PAS domain-containing protein, partial [Leptolyngbya sp.]|nr:PAS domain-containing protein [Leptolyngbya sp.]